MPNAVDRGEESAIAELVKAMKGWLNDQASESETQEDGTTKKTMGKEVKDVLAKLKRGDKDALFRIKQNVKTDDKFQLDNFDLITWLLVSVE